eukprot:TRINITY_DN4763_c0_g1_i1.p1 TRINITY_DN4763_c0_g1~~TRINITY_DN4763_c0_g1_i1.p1  ORF type:complete len:606 (-),score=102.69 TRINITY_DN4763_c0_g1_i1:684-2501(-)
MGGQVSSIKSVAGKLADSKRKGAKAPKVKIGILAFEVANVMSKALQLWQSLSEHEILRLRTEVIKAEGVLSLVSDNEALLLSLACEEKLQDLTAVACAVARLGARCQEAALHRFEYVYMDLVNQDIDLRSWEFASKEMEAKVRKMERYINSTTNLYQELEILADLEQAMKRIQEDEESAGKDALAGLEQKTVWQRQEIKYLRDVSLWNRTYDKVVSLLARTVCTIYGRVVCVFGSPMLGLPQFPPQPLTNGDLRYGFLSQPSYMSSDGTRLEMGSGSDVTADSSRSCGGLGYDLSSSPPPFSPIWENGGGAKSLSMSSVASRVSTEVRPSFYQNDLSSGPQITQHRHSTSYSPNFQNSHYSHSVASSSARGQGEMSRAGGGSFQGSSPAPYYSHALSSSRQYYGGGGRRVSGVGGGGGRKQGMIFHPKHRHRNAPSSTLGGSALALHYANVIIIIEKMVRFPHLIAQGSRDDLYQMLPNSVRSTLRSRLRAIMRCYDSTRYDSGIATDWKTALETILGWLAPLAHNMIRWQSEHNFEQQQMVARTNVLLLQTLFFADRLKAEAAVTELLVGLNYVYGHEQETRAAAAVLEYSNHEEYDEYLDWRF